MCPRGGTPRKWASTPIAGVWPGAFFLVTRRKLSESSAASHIFKDHVQAGGVNAAEYPQRWPRPPCVPFQGKRTLGMRPGGNQNIGAGQATPSAKKRLMPGHSRTPVPAIRQTVAIRFDGLASLLTWHPTAISDRENPPSAFVLALHRALSARLPISAEVIPPWYLRRASDFCAATLFSSNGWPDSTWQSRVWAHIPAGAALHASRAELRRRGGGDEWSARRKKPHDRAPRAPAHHLAAGESVEVTVLAGQTHVKPRVPVFG